MTITEFVSIGDLHLTSSTGKGGLSTYLGAAGHDDHVANLVIDQPLRWARRHQIKHVVLLGDVCEEPRMSYSAQLALIKILRQPFVFHIILGNHDLFAEDPEAGHSLEIIKELKLPNVRIYEKPTKVDGINFLPWPHQDFDPDLLNVAHVEVRGSRSDTGRVNKSETLTSSKAAAIVGHLHTHHQVRNTIYIGTLYQTNFGEHGDKFFGHHRLDAGEWVTELVPVRPVYRLHTVEASNRKDLKSVPSSKHDLVKLVLGEHSKVAAADYQHLQVVRVSAAKSGAEQQALDDLEELGGQGSRVEISTSEFVEASMANSTGDAALISRAMKLRKRLLAGS